MNIKVRVFSLFQSSMLTRRKVTQDKSIVTDFRHLNVIIAKTV